ncbi:hypothetical protein TREES_T100017942 [Tupaia chinensis]|uniref:Uncharacterized protein n=1 Tax=Tupaia chinensis TaxID=246437 RepID=L9JR58_TUPCH|nr:hypothetical protein TREES_T100017942 [Tupaia chinensis]
MPAPSVPHANAAGIGWSLSHRVLVMLWLWDPRETASWCRVQWSGLRARLPGSAAAQLLPFCIPALTWDTGVALSSTPGLREGPVNVPGPRSHFAEWASGQCGLRRCPSLQEGLWAHPCVARGVHMQAIFGNFGHR